MFTLNFAHCKALGLIYCRVAHSGWIISRGGAVRKSLSEIIPEKAPQFP